MDKKALVYMPRSCYDRMIEHIYIDPSNECGGYLIGNRVDLDNAYVFSVRELYSEVRFGTQSRFEFKLDYTSNAQEFTRKWQRERRCDDFLVGTYHSHGTFDAFHSSVDDVFARLFNLMIILSPATGRIEVWYWCLGLAQWFEGELIVYDDEENGSKRRPVYVEESELRSGREKFRMRIFRRNKKETAPKKKVLIVGCGTLGNLLAEHFIDCRHDAEITFIDRDRYEVANLPRSPVIDATAVGSPKAFALAEAVAREARVPCTVRGIVGDIREFSLDFFEQFDVIATPLDNLECRYFVNYCATVLHKAYVNLGTSYMGINGLPLFGGDVFYKPAQAATCLDCFYLLYRGNEEMLRKRVSCGGVLPEKVVPQVISSSMLIASLAFVCLMKALRNDRSTAATGYNLNDVSASYDRFFNVAPVRTSPRCSFAAAHAQKSRIKTMEISVGMHLRTLYRRVRKIFGDETEDKEYEINMISSCLTHVKYRTENPIHSITLDNESIGRMRDVIHDDYFPKDHIFAVSSVDRVKYIRIKLR